MNKGYTLIQVATTVSLCLILSTIGIMSYQKFIERSKAAICMTNQKALMNALIDYDMENSVLPAVLGDLKPRHLEKAYARVMKEAGWFVKFAHFAVKTSMSSEAYAEFLTYDNLKNYGTSQATFECPGDTNGGTSYGINGHLAGKSFVEIGNATILLGDCDSPVFTSLAELRARHDKGDVTLGITKMGTFIENANAPTISEDGTDTSTGDVASSLSDLFDQYNGTDAGKELEDAIKDFEKSAEKFSDGDIDKAIDSLKKVAKHIDKAVEKGMDYAQAAGLLSGIVGDARQMALDTLDYAKANGGDLDKISEAEQFLAEGDSYKDGQAFEDAAEAYKDVAKKSEDAM